MPKPNRDLVLVYDPEDELAFFSTGDANGKPISLTSQENDWQTSAPTLTRALGQARMDGFAPTHRIIHKDDQKPVAFPLSGTGH